MPDVYDLVIVGAGAAGLCAAIVAGQSAARVLLIEAADKVGGTFHLSSGQMSAAGTRLQAARGIEDTPQKHYDDVMRISRGTANPVLVRMAVDGAADTLHWLLDHGLEIVAGHPIIHYGHEPYSTPRTCWGPQEGRSVLHVLEPLLEAERASGRVTIWLSSRVSALIQSRDGRVTGVRAVRGGVPVQAEGEAVLLTTGGYSANATKFPRWSAGKPLFGGGYPHSQGDGLAMVEDAGGRVINTDAFLPTFAGADDPAAPGGVAIVTQTYPQFRQPWEIYVDLSGRRFMREDDPSVDRRERALLDAEDMTFWAIYDEAVRQAAPSFFRGLGDDEVSKRFETMDGYVRAASLDELAKTIGVDAGALAASVGDYNADAQSGAPDRFGREHRPAVIAQAPFYAVRHRGWSIVGFAGAAVDGELRVLDRAGAPIAGLYAAGELLGLAAFSGNAFVGGMSVTPAMTLGRLLGRRLSARARSHGVTHGEAAA